MRLLHTADLHIGKWLDTYDLREDTKWVLDQVVRIAKETKTDAVLIAGDVFDVSNPSEASLTLYLDFLKSLLAARIRVVAISGNHDSGIRLAAYRDLFGKDLGYFVQGEVEAPIREVTLSDAYGPVHFYLAPFCYPYEVKVLLKAKMDPSKLTDDWAFGALLDATPVDVSQRNVLLAHQFVAGCALSGSEAASAVGSTTNIGVDRFRAFDYVALGHIHRPMAIGRETLRYAGALLKYKASEAKGPEKSVSLVDLGPKGDVRVTTVPIVPLHPMTALTGSFDKLLATQGHREDYVCLTVTDPVLPMEARRRLESVFSRIVDLAFPNVAGLNALTEPSLETAIDDKTFLSDFYRMRKGKAIDPEDLKLAESLLAKARKGQEGDEGK